MCVSIDDVSERTQRIFVFIRQCARGSVKRGGITHRGMLYFAGGTIRFLDWS